MRWFLVTRRPDVGLVKVEVFAGQKAATKAYDAAETRILREHQRRRATGRTQMAKPTTTCVLLGADRLGTLLKTHGDWFDEPADFDLIRDLADLAASGTSAQQNPSGSVS